MVAEQRTNQRIHEICRHKVLARVKSLTEEETAKFLEYAASSNPVITNAWLDDFEGKYELY